MSRHQSTESKQILSAGGGLRIAFSLLGRARIPILATLVLSRITVGFCDLLVAAAMYSLFLLLQGIPVGHHFWWTPQTSLSAALATTIIVILRCLMDLSSARSLFWHTQDLYRHLLLQLTGGYSQMQWNHFVERNRSELLSHSLNSTREAADAFHYCVELIASVAIVIMLAVALIYQSVIAALGLGVALALVYASHRFLFRGRLKEAASNCEASQRSLHRNVADFLSAGKEIRTYRIQSFFCDRLSQFADRLTASQLKIYFLPHMSRVISDQGAVLLFLGTVILFGLRGDNSHRVLSLLVFYFVISRRLLPLISQIAYLAGRMEGAFENVRIVEFELRECRQYCMRDLPACRPGAGFALELQNVSFWFDADTPVLRAIDLSLRHGEIATLHGVSGVGKTSLLNLIAGVLEPQVGVIRVDRRNVSYMTQEVPLLDDSIRNNLLFGSAEKSDKELMEALAAARLDEFVATQTFGLETAIGDNGAMFSGGQRQRLGLARAILRGHQLLLLDEATSALDEDNERHILDNLRAMGKAVLLVTHRVHTRTYSDHVFRIEKGSLIEETSYPTLVRRTASSVDATDPSLCRCP